MQNITNEESEKIEENLSYIGLDLNQIPDFFSNYYDLKHSVNKFFDYNTYKVYKHVSIDKIVIIPTLKDKNECIKDKAQDTSDMYSYVNPNNDDDIAKHTLFLNIMLKMDIEKIEEEYEKQKKLSGRTHFKISYKENSNWQIYYIENKDIYVMVVPFMDFEYEKMLYLLKMQIDFYKYPEKYENEAPKIYVPICGIDYTEMLLTKTEINDIENYLFVFTGNYPLTYEVFDKNNNPTIQIIGNISVYEEIESKYKISINSKEEAFKTMKMLKALFMLQMEFKEKYKFAPIIDEKSNFQLKYKEKTIKYDNLIDFIKTETINTTNQLEKEIKENEKYKIDLEKIKEECKEKEKEYITCNNYIATYLECKKTFFGKIKYFIKINKKAKIQPVGEYCKRTKSELETIKSPELYLPPQLQYTLEGLLTANKNLFEIQKENKYKKADIAALTTKTKNYKIKIDSAKKFIQEIEKYKKSIFEFWKFTNEETALLLEGQVKTESRIIYEKTFDFEKNIENIDKIQRNIFTKEECDSIYAIRELQKGNKSKETEEEFDFFGNISDDLTKTKMLNGKKHRENEKEINKILKTISNEEIERKIQESIAKSKINTNISIYKVVENKSIDENLQNNKFLICNINAKNAIEESIKFSNNKITLYKFNVKENANLILYTNIMFFDNYYKTLPLGMDKCFDAIISCDNLKYKLISTKHISTNMFSTSDGNYEELEVTTICIKEYDLF